MRCSIICCLLIASLIICSTNVCFANPLDPWSDVETQIVTSGVQDIVSDVDTIRVALSTLYSYLTNNGDGVIEGLLVLANRVSNIINTLDYYLPLQNSVLQNLYSFFVPPSGDTRDIWDLLNQISANTTATSTALNTTNSELLTIDSHIDGVEGSLTSIGSKLDTVNVNLQSINSINWYNISSLFEVFYSSDNLTYYPVSNFPNDTYNDFYLKIHCTSANFPYNLVRINVPFYVSYGKVNYNVYSLEYDYRFDYFVDYHNNYSYFYFYPINFRTSNSADIIINFKSDNKILSSGSFIFNGLSESDIDFYTVNNFIQLQKLNNLDNLTNLSDIKNILIDIDNNSDFIQNNNDLQINVDIDSSVGQGVTGVISKIQDLLDFGISLQEFLVVLNQFDNLQWFTRLETYEQVNQDPRFSPGYIDLYD